MRPLFGGSTVLWRLVVVPGKECSWSADTLMHTKKENEAYIDPQTRKKSFWYCQERKLRPLLTWKLARSCWSLGRLFPSSWTGISRCSGPPSGRLLLTCLTISLTCRWMILGESRKQSKCGDLWLFPLFPSLPPSLPNMTLIDHPAGQKLRRGRASYEPKPCARETRSKWPCATTDSSCSESGYQMATLSKVSERFRTSLNSNSSVSVRHTPA